MSVENSSSIIGDPILASSSCKLTMVSRCSWTSPSSGHIISCKQHLVSTWCIFDFEVVSFLTISHISFTVFDLMREARRGLMVDSITCHAMYSHWSNSSNFFSLASISSSVALLPDGVTQIGTPSWISKSLGCLAVPLTCQISLQDPIVVWVLDL